MSEASPAYSRDRFPFAGIFEDLTDQIPVTGVGPLEAYLLYQKERRRLGLTPCPDYASTSITSGGHARRDDLRGNIGEIIQANTRTARQMAVAMDGWGVERTALVLPVDLGYIPGWKQSDYMDLWLHVIGGSDLGLKPGNQRATQYERAFANALDRSEVDLDRMNNSGLDAVARAGEYFRFAGAVALAMDEVGGNSTPVRKILS
ncbi:MAG: hypothetical protein AAB834_02115, partial [Patescibacteria group bacterium]